MSERDRVLIFTRAAGYRHESTPVGAAALAEIAIAAGLAPRVADEPGAFTAQRLARCAAVVFLSTTGTVLTETARAALADYVRAGGGFVGVHAAANGEPEWPFFGELIGARFAGHPPLQPGVILVADHAHPAMAHLPARWSWVDEWYEFEPGPSARARILATVDESSYTGGRPTNGAGHPIIWCAEVGRGRSFYTSLGHTSEGYADAAFRTHLSQGLRWSAGLI
jgi:type 1 glutamine amidotransferase